MKKILDMLQQEKELINIKIKNRDLNINAIKDGLYESSLEYENGAMHELENRLFFINHAINKVKYIMLKSDIIFIDKEEGK